METSIQGVLNMHLLQNLEIQRIEEKSINRQQAVQLNGTFEVRHLQESLLRAKKSFPIWILIFSKFSYWDTSSKGRFFSYWIIALSMFSYTRTQQQPLKLGCPKSCQKSKPVSSVSFAKCDTLSHMTLVTFCMKMTLIHSSTGGKNETKSKEQTIRYI